MLALASIRILWISLHTSSEQPLAVKGELDLRDWDFTQNRVLSSNGEWEFYPGKLLMQSPGNLNETEGSIAQTVLDRGKESLGEKNAKNLELLMRGIHDRRSEKGAGIGLLIFAPIPCIFGGFLFRNRSVEHGEIGRVVCGGQKHRTTRVGGPS